MEVGRITVNAGFDQDTLDRWWKLGTVKGLKTDSDIARFLLDLCDDNQNVIQSTAICAQCQGPLTLYCTRCQQLPQHTSSSQLPPTPNTLSTTSLVLSVHDSSTYQPEYIADETERNGKSGSIAVHTPDQAAHEDIACQQTGQSFLDIVADATLDHSYYKVVVPESSHTVGSHTSESLWVPKMMDEEETVSKPSSAAGQPGVQIFEHNCVCRACDFRCCDALGLKEHIKTHINADDKYMYCEECGERFSYRSAFRRHILIHSEERPYTCDICNARFRVPNYLRDHKRRIHTRPFRCTQCDTAFGDRLSLQKHVSKEHKFRAQQNSIIHNIEKTEVVPEGNVQTQGVAYVSLTQTEETNSVWDSIARSEEKTMSIQSNETLKIRSSASEGSAASSVLCPDCGCRFSSHSSLDAHMTTHTGQKPCRCDLCERSFSQPVYLKYHKLKHTSNSPYKCSQCSLGLLSSSRLRLHNARFHSSKKPYLCGDCGRGYAKLSQLKDHRRRYGHGDNMILSETERTSVDESKMAETSEKWNYQETSLEQKETEIKEISRSQGLSLSESHSEEKSSPACEQCGRKFSCHSSLNLHMSIHTGKKPFQCDGCDMAFRRKHQLTDHKITKHSDDKPYVCDICGHASFNARSWRKHQLCHSARRPFKCNQCGKAYKDRGCLRVHYKWAHKPVCKICGSMFSSRSAFKHHMLVHGGEKQYVCNDCGKAFCQPGHLKKHKHTHTQETYRCSQCGAQYPTPEGLAHHMQKHTGEYFVCDQCGRAFTRADSLRKHYKIKHCPDSSKNVELFECDDCGLMLHSAFRLRTHKLRHTGAYPFVCSQCDRGFGIRYDYKKHLLTHDPKQPVEKPHKCRLCGAAYLSVEKLNVHTLTHAGVYQYSCEVCGQGLSDRSCLRQHMKIHSGEKLFVCDICGAAFHQNGNLRVHKRKHTGERPYTCTHCSTSFQTSSALKRHVRTHTGEKPYTCDVCDRTFGDLSTLKKHKVKTHGAEVKLAEPSIIIGHVTSYP